MGVFYKYILLCFALVLVTFKLPGKNGHCLPMVHISNHSNTSFVDEVLFYAKELGIGDSATLQVRFSLRLPDRKNGLIQYHNTGFGKERFQVMIWIDRRLTPSEQSMTLAHEMVHAAQFLRRQLKKTGDQEFVWKGEFFHSRRVNHADRPWEKDAIERGYVLRTKYLSQLKEKAVLSIHPFPEAL